MRVIWRFSEKNLFLLWDVRNLLQLHMPVSYTHLDVYKRQATFLSVLIIPVVSFFRPIFGVGSSITLMFQAFVCARVGMDYCKSDRDKMIAGVMAAVLATQGTAWASAWALAVGFGLNVFLSNWNPLEKNHR